MTKCVYDTKNGRIYTFVRSEANVEHWLSQFEDAECIDIETIPEASRIFCYKVDLETLTLVEVQPIVPTIVPKTI